MKYSLRHTSALACSPLHKHAYDPLGALHCTHFLWTQTEAMACKTCGELRLQSSKAALTARLRTSILNYAGAGAVAQMALFIDSVKLMHQPEETNWHLGARSQHSLR